MESMELEFGDKGVPSMVLKFQNGVEMGAEEFESSVNLRVEGSLWVVPSVTCLPAGLCVTGDLVIEDNEKITSLPADLEVGGSLILERVRISVLPETVKIGKHLDFNSSPVAEAINPEKFNEYLNTSYGPSWGGVQCANPAIFGVPAAELVLPKGLKIKGNLDLTDSNVKVLPEGLEVGGDLNLSNTKVTDLPGDLKVGGNLILRGTSLKVLPNKLNVGGTVFLNETFIRSLPEGFEVSGGLSLSGSRVSVLPKSLKVAGSLDIRNTSIFKVPTDIEVRGEILSHNPKIITDSVVQRI